MMWDWESVREEACRLYLDEGLPLDQIRPIFERRGFRACERSWKSRFALWNVRRTRKVKVQGLKKTHRGSRAAAFNTGAIVDVEGNDGQRHAPVPAVRPEMRRVWLTEWTKHSRQHLSHACSCCAEILETRLREFVRTVESESSSVPGWLSAHLQRKETDNILHLLVRDVKWSRLENFGQILTTLLGFMSRHDLSVDVRDCEGRQALEHCIRTDNLQAMKMVLDHGADLDKAFDDDGDQIPALNIAIESENLGLIAELMRRTRKAHSLEAERALHLWPSSRTLTRLDQTIDSSTSKTELHDAYAVLEQLTLTVTDPDLDSDWMWEVEKILRILLVNWVSRKLSVSELDGRQWARNCLKRLMEVYLKFEDAWEPWGFSFRNMEDCVGCRCVSVGAFAIFHVRDEFVKETIMRQCTDSYVDEYLACVVATCPARHHKCNAEYLCGLLRSAMERQPKFNLLDILGTMMMRTSEDLKPAFWDTLVRRDSVDIGHGPGETIAELLAETAEPCRWKMAELVLPHDPGFPSSAMHRSKSLLFHPSPEIDFLLYSSKAYLDHLCHWSSRTCKALGTYLKAAEVEGHDWTVEASCGCHQFIVDDKNEWEDDHIFWQYETQRAYQMRRCVIHVITKDLCNQTSLFAKDMPLNERIRSALQLRQQFRLPDLAIEPSVLFQVLEDRAIQTTYVEAESEATNMDLFGPSPTPQGC